MPFLRMGVLLVLGIYGLCFVYLLYDPRERSEVLFWMTTFVGFLLSMCLACALGAVSFAREYESGTWEDSTFLLSQQWCYGANSGLRS
jgi:ABC-type transport system involved in multi-copper enzyme maturation permease subunit